jgi:hypothetical protein
VVAARRSWFRRPRTLARLHPAGRPAEPQLRTAPHWHVAMPSVAPARVVALAVGPRVSVPLGPAFLCSASAAVALQAPHFPVAEVVSMPIPDDWRSGSVGLGAPGEERRSHCADTGQ